MSPERVDSWMALAEKYPATAYTIGICALLLFFELLRRIEGRK